MPQTAAQKRAYQRKWYKLNRSASAKIIKGVPVKHIIKASEPTSEQIVGVVKAYKVLSDCTNDGQIKADLTKIFTSIIVKLT